MAQTLLSEHFKKNVLIAKTGRYVYVMVPKAGNSSVKRILWAAEREDRPELPEAPKREGTLHQIKEGPFLSGAEKWRATLAEPCFYFTVVRNPFARALSGYIDKSNRVEGATDFKSFLRILSKSPPEAMDHHFAPQSAITQPDVMAYDKIIPLEQFDVQFAPVYERLFGRSFQAVPPANQTGSASKIMEVYDHECVDLVREIYASDFELFGYSRDLEDWGKPFEKPVTGQMHVGEVQRLGAVSTPAPFVLRLRQLIRRAARLGRCPPTNGAS